MSKGAQKSIAKTRDLPFPNYYVQALLGEYSQWAFCEETVPGKKGKWADEFKNNLPIDVEIGTGNGTHFAHYVKENPSRNLVGIELKYKPLIQSIRRAVKQGSVNARMARYNASMLKDIFCTEEIDDVYIFFPDPWSKLSQNKHRLIQEEFLSELHLLQKPSSKIYFKTDNKDYFDWSLEVFKKSSYDLVDYTYDLHNSEWQHWNYKTAFENIFLKEGLNINFAYLSKR